MSKKGSAGEWFLVILVSLIVGGAVLLISSNITYSKKEVDSLLSNARAEVVSAGYSKCETVQLTFGPRDSSYKSEFVGKTPRQICAGLGKGIKFLDQIYNYNLYYGDTAETCDDYHKNDLAIGMSDYGYAEESLFDEALRDKSDNSCDRISAKSSIGMKTTVHRHAICC